MCGIAGFAGWSEDVGTLRAMREALVHRGPDSSGELVTPEASFGVRRLRIIDLVTGDQPIANEDGSVHTVFNGEIYNYRELRAELICRGHRFSTASDTEVLVHGYEEFGATLPTRLEGMFAFAIWDARSRLLLLARDRLGKKPLLYSSLPGGGIAFASEFRGLLAHPAVDRKIDLGAIDLYLSFGYVPAPATAFRSIRKLPPAHTLTWHAGKIELKRYWRLPRFGSLQISEREAADELLARLRSAVRARLIADVPIGAFLSGGLDSSTVVALMAEHTTVRTFSVGFSERAYDELEHARRIASRYATEHQEFVVRPDATLVSALLATHFGEPFADSSAVPTYYLAKVTREHVTVALTGDGGDDILGGYDRHLAMRLAEVPPLPRPVRGALYRIAAKVVPTGPDLKDTRSRLRRFLDTAWQRPERRYLGWVGLFDADWKARLLAEDLVDGSEDRALELVHARMCESGSRDPLDQALSVDLTQYLPDDLLVKADISSMANSLELRSPFLDRSVVEFAAALPAELKVRGLTRKHLLRQAVRDLVPAKNVQRPKMGFGVPLGAWFRGPLREVTADLILASSTTGPYFRRAAVEELVAEHLAGRRDHGQRLWALLMLELWHRQVLGARAVDS